jgi:hypothetical protein
MNHNNVSATPTLQSGYQHNSMQLTLSDLDSWGAVFSSVALPLREAFRAQSVCVSDFKYVVLMCFGFGLGDVVALSISMKRKDNLY